MAKTRLDRIVRLREREETDALVHLARAQAHLSAAHGRLQGAAAAAAADGRGPGQAALWDLDDAAHRRALQGLRAALGELDAAARKRDDARGEYAAARQDAEALRRAADRKRAEVAAEGARRERRAVDEVATLRFNLR
jgi:flagellar export protein FliJ